MRKSETHPKNLYASTENIKSVTLHISQQASFFMIPALFFPEGISYYFTEDQKDMSVLKPNELMIVEKYGAKRMSDFCTGRYCLRKCMEPLGFDGEILVGERGMPLLPTHITASLSHSKTLCGAIAGHKEQFQSLGFDIETCGRVHTDMWRLLFTKNETEFLNSLDTERRNLLSTVFFSLKEAFYKLQYPLTGVFLDFPEVEVMVENDELHVKLLRRVNGHFTEGLLTGGRMLHHNEQVITYCVLPAITA